MDEEGKNLYAGAVRIMAEWELEERQKNPRLPRISSAVAWLAKAESSIRSAHSNEVEHLDLTRYTDETLAARLIHGPGGRPTPRGWTDDRPHPKCARCQDSGWIFTDIDGNPDDTHGGYDFVARCACEEIPA